MGARAPQIPHWHEILCIRYAAATQVRYLGLTTARPGTAHTPLHSIKFLDQRFCSTIFPLLPEEKYIIFFFFLFHMGTPPHQCIPPVGLAQGMFLPQHPRAGNTTVPAPVVLLPAGGVGGVLQVRALQEKQPEECVRPSTAAELCFPSVWLQQSSSWSHVKEPGFEQDLRQ